MPDIIELKSNEFELKQDEFYYGIDFDAKRELLDDIIQEEIDRYYILELGYKKPEDVYLNEEQQTELIKAITRRVYTLRMTPAVLSNISFYYKFNTEKDLLAIIMDRVSFGVLGLTLKTNTTSLPL